MESLSNIYNSDILKDMINEIYFFALSRSKKF